MRSFLSQFLKILISAILIGFLLNRIGIARIWAQFREADIFWFMGGLILFTASHFLGSWQWQLLLRAETIQIPWNKTLSFYFVGLFFNNFFVSGMGGDFFRIMDARRVSRNGTAAISTVFLDRLIGLLVLSGMALLPAPWLVFHGKGDPLLWISFILLIVGWIVVFFFLFYRPFARPLAWFIRKISPQGIATKFRDVYLKIHSFRHNFGLLGKVLVISVFVQGARIWTHYFLGRSLGVTVSPIYYFMIIPIVAIISSLPVTFGGLGLREQTGVVLFGMVGMTALLAFSIEFLAYWIAILSSLPGGVIFIFRNHVEQIGKKKVKETVVEGEAG